MDRILAALRETYCVVGVRADDSRHVLSMKLSLEDASYLKRVLLKADIFKAVLIQRDEPQLTRQGPVYCLIALRDFNAGRRLSDTIKGIEFLWSLRKKGPAPKR